MIEALMVGKLDEAKVLYRDIIFSSNGYPIVILQTNILRLAIAINVAVNLLEKNSNNLIYSSFTNFTFKLNKCETIEEIDDLFFQLFDIILSEQEKWKSSKHEKLLLRIYEIIQNQYADKNISLDSIADILCMSPIYLGRLFKKLTSKSISSYINGVRIEKAKDLLIVNELSINEISDKVGFITGKYFFILFKKMNGVTPSEFRNNARCICTKRTEI